MYNKIELTGFEDIKEFCNICGQVNGKVELVSKTNGYRVNGKSVIGALASLEFGDTWVYSEEDIYSKIEKWIVEDDSAAIHN
jgi:hypothetical protein